MSDPLEDRVRSGNRVDLNVTAKEKDLCMGKFTHNDYYWFIIFSSRHINRITPLSSRAPMLVMHDTRVQDPEISNIVPKYEVTMGAVVTSPLCTSCSDNFKYEKSTRPDTSKSYLNYIDIPS
jgi:hypothetical protein